MLEARRFLEAPLEPSFLNQDSFLYATRSYPQRCPELSVSQQWFHRVNQKDCRINLLSLFRKQGSLILFCLFLQTWKGTTSLHLVQQKWKRFAHYLPSTYLLQSQSVKNTKQQWYCKAAWVNVSIFIFLQAFNFSLSRNQPYNDSVNVVI